eukprot:766228-Hanusia_phi.AAC.2
MRGIGSSLALWWLMLAVCLEVRQASGNKAYESCSQEERREPGRLLQSAIEVIDWDSRIFKIEDFLSSPEVDEMIGLGQAELNAQHGNAWQHLPYGAVFFRYQKDRMARRLVEIEDRIARVTMIQPHPDELPLMFTRQIPGATVGNVIPNQKLRNVHHDKNHRENRVVTVLIYLSDARDGDGGHTIFPCLASQNLNISGLSYFSKFKRLFQNGSRQLDGEARTDDEVKLLKACNQECLRADRAEVLNFQPRKGTAIIFWNVHPDGHPNLRVWHAACQALQGEHRYALQKFKELPRSTGEWVMEQGAKSPKWVEK